MDDALTQICDIMSDDTTLQDAGISFLHILHSGITVRVNGEAAVFLAGHETSTTREFTLRMIPSQKIVIITLQKG